MFPFSFGLTTVVYVCICVCVCVRACACVSCLVMSYVTRRRATKVKDGRFSSIYEAVSIKASQAS